MQKAGVVSVLEPTELDTSGAVAVSEAPNLKEAVLQAFKRLWDSGVVQCDVADSNIIVRLIGKATFHVSLLDFGLSEIFPGGVPNATRDLERKNILNLHSRSP